ncbi:MAG: CotH kinase family protein [Dysgonamonadaceae bacterium]|jgi:hypothetical protein|nr:CotH kinase family protein [Dysgonamonadaceae bacterium]
MSKNVISILFLALLTNGMLAQQQLTNLPALYITTANAALVHDKETWVPGHIRVLSSDASENLDMDLEIRGRGNSTWNLAKKPYRIKLASKTKLLNLPAKQKNWVLLANHADKTLIRNAVSFKISEMLGFEYTPPTRFVDVYLNGQFLGNYHITDQIEVASKRVPVEEQDTTVTALPDLAGGYLVEIDGFADSEPVKFTTTKAMKVTVKYPKSDEINNAQLNYIRNVIQNFEDALFSSGFADPNTGYRSLADTASLINWYIASELTGDPDCFWSTYIYKKRTSDKLFFGPLWDKDIAFNNCNRIGEATQKLMRENAFNPRTWIQRLWEDEWFRAAVNRRWIEFKNGDNLETALLAYIAELNTLLAQSQQQNFTRWNVLNTRVYNELQLFPTYAGGINFLKNYITQRIAFLTESFAGTQPVLPSQPFVAENFYYRIINEGSNNAIDVQDNSLLDGANLVMWSPIQENLSQLWSIVPLANGQYQFLNMHSGLAMQGNGRSNSLTQTAPDIAMASQRWKITPVLTGNIYGLENVATNYSANNSGGSAANGTALIEYDNNITLADKRNQHWYIDKVMEIPQITSLQNIVIQDIIKIYPNPATDWIAIDHLPFTCLPFTIYSLTGKQVVNGQWFNGQSVDVSNLPAGIFIVKIGDYRGKFVKK